MARWVSTKEGYPTESGFYVMQTVRRYAGLSYPVKAVLIARWSIDKTANQQAATSWAKAVFWYDERIPDPPKT